MERLFNKMYRKTKRDKLMLTSSSSLLSSSKRALSQTPNSETQLKNSTARVTAVKIEYRKRCQTNFELMQPAETEDLAEMSQSVGFGQLGEVLHGQLGEVLHGRVEVYGQHNVGKDTLISRILLRRPGVDERNFDYLATDSKYVALSLKNMEQNVSKSDTHLLESCRPSIEPDVCVVVFSLLNRASFQYAKQKVQDLKRNHNGKISILLLGNKSDAIQNRRVSNKEACLVARIHGCQYLETAIIYDEDISVVLHTLLVLIQRRNEKDQTIIRNIQRHVLRCIFPPCCERL